MTNSLKLKEPELDALRECGNVGIGNAVTALSQLINKKIGINIPETKFIELADFSKEIGGAETIVSGIYLQILGDLQGQAMFIFSEDAALELVDLMMGNKPGSNPRKIAEDDESAIKEMGNIFVGAYLNAMSDLLDLKILPGIPAAATDMAQSVIDLALIKLAEYSDNILIVREEIDIEGHNVNGIFIIIFDDDSLKKTIGALHKKYGVV